MGLIAPRNSRDRGPVVRDMVPARHRSDPDLAFPALRLEDCRLLERWLAEPHVATWWRDPSDRAAVEAKYGPRIEGTEPSHVHVILHRGEPIGWIQWYRWADYPEHAARLGAGPTEAGVDLAIGDPALVGRGIGTRVLCEFVDQVVFADPAITGCVSDPDPANLRSVRAFVKAGFAETSAPGAPLVVRRERAG